MLTTPLPFIFKKIPEKIENFYKKLSTSKNRWGGLGDPATPFIGTMQPPINWLSK